MTGKKTFTENFSNLKILIVGDVMLDRYLWGSVNRISPEAPVPIVNINKTSVVLGGAANVAANVAGLGAEPILVGITGRDSEADALAGILEKSNISANFLVPSETRRTTIKTRLVAHNQHVVRFDQETTNPITESEAETVFEKLEGFLEAASIVIISDYAKGLLTQNLLTRLIKSAKEKNKLILVDPKGKDFSKYKGATILTPNRREAAEATGFDENGNDLVNKAGKKLLEDLSLEALLITKGEKGLTLLQKGGETFHLEASARNVYDVTGAGDTVIAGFGVAVAAGADYLDAAKFANLSAGLVVQQIGTTAISLEMLQSEIKNQEL
ncbi:MAG TPA: D-glycero-beta-D-manno-heptose-7-phosphate kinase [Pyrinomonadaceae bacterium]